MRKKTPITKRTCSKWDFGGFSNEKKEKKGIKRRANLP